MTEEKKRTNGEIASKATDSDRCYCEAAVKYENRTDKCEWCQIMEALDEKDKEIARLKLKADKFDQGVKDLDAQLAIQEDEPMTQEDGYMCGLLNGMLLAKSDLTKCEYRPHSYKDRDLASARAKYDAYKIFAEAKVARLSTLLEWRTGALRKLKLMQIVEQEEIIDKALQDDGK